MYLNLYTDTLHCNHKSKISNGYTKKKKKKTKESNYNTFLQTFLTECFNCFNFLICSIDFLRYTLILSANKNNVPSVFQFLGTSLS